MSAATSIQKLRLMAREAAFDYRKQDLLNAANDMEEMSLRLDEWRNVFPGKTPAEAAEIVKEVIIRLENYQAQRPLTTEEKAWAEKAWQEYKVSPPKDKITCINCGFMVSRAVEGRAASTCQTCGASYGREAFL